MSFSQWLRGNSERYLLEAAQTEIARRYLPPERLPQQKSGAFFWRRIFVPSYKLVPWSVRRAIMQLMPGSHRRAWKGREPP